jgi:hypothetical protein
MQVNQGDATPLTPEEQASLAQSSGQRGMDGCLAKNGKTFGRRCVKMAGLRPRNLT